MDHSGMGHNMAQPEPSKNTVDTSTLAEAEAPKILEVKEGETIDLNPEVRKKTLEGAPFPVYPYNG